MDTSFAELLCQPIVLGSTLDRLHLGVGSLMRSIVITTITQEKASDQVSILQGFIH
jgi:hypothetical protein